MTSRLVGGANTSRLGVAALDSGGATRVALDGGGATRAALDSGGATWVARDRGGRARCAGRAT